MARFAQLFGTSRKPLMGVDISATRVKLLELDGSPEAMRVISYASEPLPADAVADNQIVNAEAVAGAVSRALERTRSRTRDAAIAVSGPAVISKIIDMPAGLTDADMEQQIHLDAEQYIPHAIEEVNLDFQILEPDHSNADVNRVLLVACRRDNIEMRTAALEMARMNVRLVDVEEYALQNACGLLASRTPTLDTPSSVAVFDIGAHRTRLSVQRDGRSVYTREIAFGAEMLANALMEHHKLDDTEQLRTRLRSGDLEAEHLSAQINDFAERAATQIERTIQFYVSASATDDEAVDQVIVVGGAGLYPGFEAALKTHLHRPVTLGNPLAGVLASADARRNHVDSDAPALMVATGLAMRNLLP